MDTNFPHKPVGFKIVKISINNFSIQGEVDTKVRLNVSHSFNFGLPDQKFIVSVLVNTSIEEKSSKKSYFRIEVVTDFKISKESWELFTESGKLILPKALAAHLIALNISTTRGIIHAKKEGPAWENFVLPIINLKGVINEDIELELNH